jgi:hypothetical protein
MPIIITYGRGWSGRWWQKHFFVRKWISQTKQRAHSQMLILATRFLWFHFARLIEKKKALPQNIDQQYIMNVFCHVSKVQGLVNEIIR